MNSAVTAALAIATAIVGLATLAVIVSRNSATSDVVAAFGNAFSSAIKEAVSPISTGQGAGSSAAFNR
jgi:hypothetical protein